MFERKSSFGGSRNPAGFKKPRSLPRRQAGFRLALRLGGMMVIGTEYLVPHSISESTFCSRSSSL